MVLREDGFVFKGKRLVIPLNLRDGSLLSRDCIGSESSWNTELSA